MRVVFSVIMAGLLGVVSPAGAVEKISFEEHISSIVAINECQAVAAQMIAAANTSAGFMGVVVGTENRATKGLQSIGERAFSIFAAAEYGSEALMSSASRRGYNTFDLAGAGQHAFATTTKAFEENRTVMTADPNTATMFITNLMMRMKKCESVISSVQERFK